jgi:hypothetical protein
MSFVTAGVTVAAAGISAYAAYSGSQAQAKAAGVQAGIDRQNASITREQNRMSSMAELRSAELAHSQGQIGLVQNAVASHNQRLQDLFQKSQMMFSAVQADRDAVILDAQAKVHEYNAERLFQFGRQTETMGREQARRMRQQGDRVMGAIRSGYAKGGITESGSALDVMADTAGLIELQAQGTIYESRVESQNLYTQSDSEKIAGTISGFNAQTARDSAANARRGIQIADSAANLNQMGFALEHQSGLLALQGIEYRKQMASFGLKMADAGYSINMQQSSLNQFAALSQARSMQLAAVGTAIGGVSSGAQTYMQFRPPQGTAQPIN